MALDWHSLDNAIISNMNKSFLGDFKYDPTMLVSASSETRTDGTTYTLQFDTQGMGTFRTLRLDDMSVVAGRLPLEGLKEPKSPKVERVVHNGPATVVFFDDGTKVVAKCVGDKYDERVGILTSVFRKHMGSERCEPYEKAIRKVATLVRSPKALIALGKSLVRMGEWLRDDLFNERIELEDELADLKSEIKEAQRDLKGTSGDVRAVYEARLQELRAEARDFRAKLKEMQ